MNIRDSILLVFFANLLSSAVMVLNGRAAAKYHIGFPALARAAFGTYGSYFYIIIRSILGIIWGGVYVAVLHHWISNTDNLSPTGNCTSLDNSSQSCCAASSQAGQISPMVSQHLKELQRKRWSASSWLSVSLFPSP